MPTTRQINFIQSLATERGSEALRVAIANAAGRPTALQNLTSREASAVIERLLVAPRTDRSAAPAARQDGEAMPAPSTGTRAGRMLLAGGIEATVTLADGRHATVSIRTRKRSGRGWTNAALGEQDSRTNVSILGQRIGWVTVDADGRVLLTLRTRRQEYVTAVTAVFEYAAGLPTPGERVQEASRCGRCFRTLTDPVSIDRGIGPECYGRDTGSQHIAAERRAAGQDVRPEPAAPRTETVYRNREDALAAAGTSLSELAAAAESRRAVTEEDRMHAAFAQAEQAAERAAYEREMQEERAAQATTRRVDSSATDVARARDLIAEALDSYFGEPELSFALNIFDQLAAR